MDLFDRYLLPMGLVQHIAQGELLWAIQFIIATLVTIITIIIIMYNLVMVQLLQQVISLFRFIHGTLSAIPVFPPKGEL